MNVWETITNYLSDSGFGQFHWSNAVMMLVGALFIFLAVRKKFEPLLLVPIGFGILIGNIPYNASKLSLGEYDGPVSEHDIAYVEFTLADADERQRIDELARYIASDNETPSNVSVGYEAVRRGLRVDEPVRFATASVEPSRIEGLLSLERGEAVMVNRHSLLSPRSEVDGPGVYPWGQGRWFVVVEENEDEQYPELWSLERQDPRNASVFWWLYAGVGLAGFYPPLIFLGIGALTDFGPMLSRWKTLLLGAAAQFGIFGSLLLALAVGFDLDEAASIGIIGGADGPTAIFTCAQLSPELLGAVALAAYSYMALVPIIQPPIIKLLTTKEERRIRMVERDPVSKEVRIIFPIIGFVFTAMIAPGGLPLLGMLFFGNLLRESLVTDRLAKTAQGPFIDIVTILLGVTVGAKATATTFLTWQTIYIFVIGVTAFALATATGVLFGKLMSKMSKNDPVNPMIGAAGVSAVPMAARVVHKLGLEEDDQNYLLMHAMGPNVAGVIGSAVAAGVLLSTLGGQG
jgi:oxaloacetate decarboxylase beta subunit